MAVAAIGCCLLLGGGVYLSLRSPGASAGAEERLAFLARDNDRLKAERDDLVQRIERLSEEKRRLATSAESIAPPDGLEAFKRYGTVAKLAMRGSTRESTYPLDDQEATRESILKTWKTDYRIGEAQSEAAAGIVAEFVQRANAAWERGAPQDPKDLKAAEALRMEFLDLQIEAERLIVSLMPAEEQERLVDLEPLLIRFKATGKAQGTMSGFPGFSY